jgi:hypothetical protein
MGALPRRNMELSWNTPLLRTEEILEALELLDISARKCDYYNCKRPDVVSSNICKILAGKEVSISGLINDIIEGCESACPKRCLNASNIKERILTSANAYQSPDGRRFWPNPKGERKENRISRFEDFIFASSEPIIQHESVVTMGSCFMNEINKHLTIDNYLMRAKEENYISEHIFPASWGTVFSPISAQYALDYYFDQINRPELLWKSSHTGDEKYFDVFREDVLFNSIDEYRRNTQSHRIQAKQLLKTCKSFVAAFSMIETWLTSDKNKYPLSRSPWRINPLAAKPHTLTYDDAKSSIKSTINTILTFNPKCNILIGVDPVPLHATHSDDNCIKADSRAKGVLVAATLDAIDNIALPNVKYMPFFEIVHYCTKEPWCDDERHINSNTIRKVYKELLSFLSSE